MNYLSTRGNAAAVDFEDALLRGLAEDGGLYMPAHWPQISPQQIAAFRDAPYADIAFACLRPFLDAHWPDTELRAVIARACVAFDHAAVAPLRPLGENEYLLELFHGPTLSFKDVAMQLLAGLFTAALRRRGGRATIIAATSGDTGSAAIHGFRGMEEVDVFILYPHGRISDAQRRQMTTPSEENVHAVAVEGSFDDCQSLVKQCFADESLRRDLSLTAVNSINWARIMAQAVYYFAAAAQLDSPRPPRFTVPTGNFGNIFAGYGAMRMGLPLHGLVIATNANDLLYRCFHEGEYHPREVIPTCAPSMDIQIASNFERLVFELAERDSAVPRRFIEEVKTHGRFAIPAPMRERLRALFRAERIFEEEIPAVMEEVWRQSGVEIDPHTAIGVGASRRARGDGEAASDIILATAHPAKFPASRIAPPRKGSAEARIDALREQPERLYRLPAEMPQVRSFLREHSRLSRNRS